MTDEAVKIDRTDESDDQQSVAGETVEAAGVDSSEVDTNGVDSTGAEVSADTGQPVENSPAQAAAAVAAELPTDEAVSVKAAAEDDESTGDGAVGAEVTNDEAAQASTEEQPAEKKGGMRELTPEQQKLPWYVVHSYSGFEMRVKLGLEERIRAANLQHKFGNIIVPEEKVVELVRGEKKTSSRKFFPGYILVQCDLDDETWHLVKATPKVTGFVGDSRNPMPLLPHEVEGLIAQMEGGAQRARPRVEFEQGDSIKVIDGPFADFNGTVDEVKADKGKLRVLISIFGRNTPVELDFVQVEKV